MNGCYSQLVLRITQSACQAVRLQSAIGESGARSARHASASVPNDGQCPDVGMAMFAKKSQKDPESKSCYQMKATTVEQDVAHTVQNRFYRGLLDHRGGRIEQCPVPAIRWLLSGWFAGSNFWRAYLHFLSTTPACRCYLAILGFDFQPPRGPRPPPRGRMEFQCPLCSITGAASAA